MLSCVDQINDTEFSGDTAGHRILIVEDEILIALDLKGRLENSGYEVAGIAASAHMALSLANCHTPDLILMDIRLQGGSDGIEAAAEVEKQMDIPVIFLTSHSDIETLERARLSEPFGYVVKPFGSVNFRALIEIALQKHQTERSLRKSVRWYTTLEKRRLMRLFNEQLFGPEGDAESESPWEQERSSCETVSLEAIPEAIVGIDQEGKIVLINARAERMFGYEREALLGENIEILVPGHFKNLMRTRETQKSAEETEPVETGLSCVHKNGSEFPAEISLGAMKTEEGHVLLATFRDTGERKRSEAGREQLATIVNSTDSAIVSVTMEGIIATWNRGAEQLYGYSPAEVLGEPLSILLPADRMHEVSASLRALRAGGRFQKETIRRTRDGRLIDVLQTVSPIQDGAGRVTGAVITATDISPYLRAEAKFRGLLEVSPDAVVVTGPEGRIVLANARAEKLFGNTQEELLGESIETLIPKRFRGRHPELRGNFFAAAGVRAAGGMLTLCGLRRNGEEFPVEISLGPLETKEGIFVSTTIRDVTERKLSEEKMRRSLQEKDTMLHEIHHRVKNNLQFVSSLLSLQGEQIQDPDVRRIFSDNQGRIQAMAQVHQQLHAENNMAVVDLAYYLRSLSDRVLASWATSATSFRISVDSAEALLSPAEAIPCGLIVNELISNSLKHSFHGRTSGEIRVGFRASAGTCVLTVDDDGSPLPDDIFNRQTSTMGMRLVQALASQLEGRLQIGDGPKFTIAFPDRRPRSS